MSRELLYEDDGGRQSMYRHRGVRFAECAMVETMGYQGGWIIVSGGICYDAPKEYRISQT